MKISLVRIGNSRGLRLPKPVIEQCGFGSEVEMAVRGKDLVIHAANRPRQQWAAAFQEMAARGDDRLPDRLPMKQTNWDKREWEWK